MTSRLLSHTFGAPTVYVVSTTSIVPRNNGVKLQRAVFIAYLNSPQGLVVLIAFVLPFAISEWHNYSTVHASRVGVPHV
jgi:hypothetical protein